MRSALFLLFPAVVLLAACASKPAITTAVPSPSASGTSCALAVTEWSAGRGGIDFHQVLDASSAMRNAIKSDSQTRADASVLRTAVHQADRYQPPACVKAGDKYRTAMSDWLTAAADASKDKLSGCAAKLAKGAAELDAITPLEHLSPVTLERLTHRVVVSVTAAAATSAPPATPPAPSAPPVAAPSPPPPPPATSPAGCYPISDEGTCYEPGEYCRDDDHGMSGVAGDGESIVCEDNDGWRWEPV
jgi:hypothetical protein